MKRILATTALLTLAFAGFPAVLAQSPQQPARRVFTPDGTVHVPAFDLPPSTFLSAEALAEQKARADRVDIVNYMAAPSIEQMRATTEQAMAPFVAQARQRYAVDIVEQRIAGVRTRIVTPKGGEADGSRVLINLHGGGFMMCAEGCALVESIPIASVGRFKVVTVDYRQGPENAFPAASEDVASVYRDLLKTYEPQNIGIYGCSAGGALTAQSVAWFADKKIPMPGAVGIFGAGGFRGGTGDSAYLAGYIDGMFPPPGPNGETRPSPYFRTARLDDPLVSPAAYPDSAGPR